MTADILVPCSLNDAGFNKCLLKNVQVILTTWKDGVPGTKSIGSWEPFTIKSVKLVQNGNSALSLNADLRNLVVKGASHTVFKELR